MTRFDNTVTVVTGGASAQGIGRATALLLASLGGKVLVGDISDALGSDLVADLGPEVSYHHLDVTKESSWASLAAYAAEHVGQVTGLVNCAGIALDGTIESTPIDDYYRVVDVTQTGAWLGIRAFAPVIREAGGGAIVNISSVAGAVGQPCLGSYSAAKWAIRGITRQAAIELADSGIRVNAVLPGFIDTMMGGQGESQRESIRRNKRHSGATIPLGRIGEPQEVARLVAFLMSEDSSYCTGADFVIDGGLLAGPLAEDADWA